MRYTIAVQNINGAGPQARGVAVDAAAAQNIHERYTTCTFPVNNTGAAADVGSPHPEDASAYLNHDVYRLSASADGRRLAGPAGQRAGHRPVRRVGGRAGLRDPRPRQLDLRHDQPDGHVRQRPDQDLDGHLRGVRPGPDGRRRDARLPPGPAVGQRRQQQGHQTGHHRAPGKPGTRRPGPMPARSARRRARTSSTRRRRPSRSSLA